MGMESPPVAHSFGGGSEWKDSVRPSGSDRMIVLAVTATASPAHRRTSSASAGSWRAPSVPVSCRLKRAFVELLTVRHADRSTDHITALDNTLLGDTPAMESGTGE